MNPNKVLNLAPGAGKKEILMAVARAMREKKFSAKEIAIAQKQLLNPVKRIELLFEDLDFSDAINAITVEEPVIPDLKCLENPIQFQ